VNPTEIHLLDAVRAFCFPGGEDAARRVKAIRITERGEMQTAPKARAIAFTARQEIDACASRFRWEARFRGGLGFFNVIDAYEDGRGFMTIRAGVLPLKKMAGPDFDVGELQRYLASFAFCPPMLLNNRSLVWTPVRPGLVRVQEGGAAIDLEFDEHGCPVDSRCERPRMVGSQAVLTPWSARAGDFRDCDGIRVGGRTEASWHLPEGPFRYYQSEVTSLMALA
jgi:hypothetical protein